MNRGIISILLFVSCVCNAMERPTESQKKVIPQSQPKKTVKKVKSLAQLCAASLAKSEQSIPDLKYKLDQKSLKQVVDYRDYRKSKEIVKTEILPYVSGVSVDSTFFPSTKLSNHTSSVHAIDSCPKKELLATGSWDGKIGIYKKENGQWQHTGYLSDGLGELFNTVKVMSDQSLLSSTFKEIHIWDLNKGEAKSIYKLPKSTICCEVELGDNCIYTGLLKGNSHNGTVCLLDQRVANLTPFIDAHRGTITGLKRKNNTLITTSLDKSMKLWDIRKNKEPIQKVTTDLPIHSMVLLLGDQIFLSARNNLKLYSMDGQLLDAKNYKQNVMFKLYNYSKSAISLEQPLCTTPFWRVKNNSLEPVVSAFNSLIFTIHTINPETIVTGHTKGIKIWDVSAIANIMRGKINSKNPLPDAQKLSKSIQGKLTKGASLTNKEKQNILQDFKSPDLSDIFNAK